MRDGKLIQRALSRGGPTGQDWNIHGRQGTLHLRLIRLLKGELAREARDWVADGLVERQQADAILARYGTSLEDAAGRGLGQRILTALAVLFFGLSLMILIGHNWEHMPRLARMLGLIGLTMALNAVAIHRWWRGREQVAVLWWFAGGLSYGISIMLIAQIYHLGEHFPDGIFWWALGVLPVAILTGSRLLHLLQLSLAGLWVLVELQFSIPWTFLLFAGAALHAALWGRGSLVLFLLALVLAGVWFNGLYIWTLHPDRPQPDAGMVGLNAGLALLAWGLALSLSRSDRRLWQEYGLVLGIWLLRGLLLALFFFSFDNAWRGFLGEWQEDGLPGMVLLLIAGGLLLAWMIRLTAFARKRLLAALVPTLLLFAAALFLPETRSSAILLAVVVNLALLVLAITLLGRGLDTGQSHLFYTGVAVLLLLALLRYVDLMGDYIGASLMFAIAGLVMMAAARFWRRRVEGEGAP